MFVSRPVSGLIAFLLSIVGSLDDDQLEFARDEMIRIHKVYRDELERRKLKPSCELILLRPREPKE